MCTSLVYVIAESKWNVVEVQRIKTNDNSKNIKTNDEANVEK